MNCNPEEQLTALIPSAAEVAEPRTRKKPKRQWSSELPRLDHPAKEVVAGLPPYVRLPLNRIRVVQSPADEDFAVARMAESGMVGFDTETKPVFQAGQSADGPHVIQLATLDYAFIFQVGGVGVSSVLRECLESPHLLKIGFGLNSDRGPLYRKFGVKLQNVVDVSRAFRPLGYRQRVGAKASVAIVLGMRLQKSKKMTTSNWANRRLTPEQLQYAADDAQAGLAVYLAMGCPSVERFRQSQQHAGLAGGHIILADQSKGAGLPAERECSAPLGGAAVN